MTQDPLIIIENVSIAQWVSSISWVYKQKWSDHLTCSWNLSPKNPEVCQCQFSQSNLIFKRPVEYIVPKGEAFPDTTLWNLFASSCWSLRASLWCWDYKPDASNQDQFQEMLAQYTLKKMFRTFWITPIYSWWVKFRRKEVFL